MGLMKEHFTMRKPLPKGLVEGTRKEPLSRFPWAVPSSAELAENGVLEDPQELLRSEHDPELEAWYEEQAGKDEKILEQMEMPF